MAAGVGSEMVVAGLDEPRAVAVDALRGKLYWADAGTDRIERANLDGSAVESLTGTGQWPTAIALGPPTQNLTYTITAGNTNGAFDLDPVTGVLTVANSSELDFETTPTFNLTVTVTDAGGRFDTATITVNLNDINDAPVINDATFSVDENSANGTAVGSVPVTDPDAGDSHVYSIPVGNTGGAFAIDNAGNITVANSAALNFETTPVFTLTVQVRDQGGTGIIDTATITVNLNDINDAPVINDATFSVDENSANGTAVGSVPVTDPDAGDSHVYSIPVGNTGGAFAIDNAGNITVANSAALNFETTPVFTLTVQVRDQGGTGIIDTATITVNLNDINDAPVINDATFSVDENSANGTAVGSVPVTDPDAGDSHVYSIPVGNTGGAFAIDNAGNITVANSAALNFETTPVFTLTVQVRDQGGTGIIDTATITVNLNDINDAPVINDATFSVDENSANGTAVGSVPVTDPDAGDSHVYSIPVGNTGGAFAIDNAGNITVANSAALNFETTPVFTLTVQVRDQGGTGIIDTATITVNLNDINDAPVINDATFSVDENSANGTAVGSVPVTDPDAGDSHVYSIPVGNTGGAFAIDNAGNITVANSAALNFETTPVFTLTVQVRDQGGTGIIDTATITVNLNDINDAPVINDATFSVDENSANGTAVGSVPVTDPDAGDSHVYSIPVGNTGGAFAIDNAGNITVANSAALNFETTPVFTLTVQVRDQGGTGIIDTATITVNLNDINDAPVINDATFSVDENSANGTAVGSVPVTDPDAGDSHVYSIPVGNTGGAFAIDNAGNITVANSAALNFETTPVFTLTVQVRDQGGTGIIDTATITVNLNDINDAPVINDATFSVDENSANGTAVGSVPVTDPDAGDSHVYSIPVGNTGGAFAIDNAGNITVANSAALNFETTPVFTLTVQVRDQGGTGIIDTATITVNLNDINDAPVINDATFSVDENSANGTAVGSVPVTDPDAGDSHVYSIPVGNTGGAFAIDNAGNITVANSAALNFETTPVFTLTVQVRDQGGTGIIDTATITVNLNDINDAPVINDATFSVDENSANGTAVGSVPVTDPDAGDSHVYSIPVGNTGGAFAIDNAGNITVANSAALNFETTPVFTLTVQVRDQGGTGIIDTATITVNLNDINDAPVINDATFSVDENSANGTAVGSVPVTDPDAGDSHVYSIPVGNTGGAFAIDNAGNITVANSAALNFETTPVFTLTVQVRDQGGTGIIDTATITVNLNDINDAPVINDATFSVDENSANGTAVGSVPVTDPDAGDSHVYSIPVGNTGGAFAVDNAGNITVANSAALNFETTPVFTLTVQVRDQGGTGIIDTATITVNLNDINDAPVINDATFSVDENSANGTAVGSVPVTDPDAGDSHVYSIPVGNTGGAFAIDNAGNITVANSAALNFETTPVFTLTVQVRDQGGTGIIDTATITVNLNDINDAPVINDATFSVDENSANGTAVGSVPVTDPDAGDSHVYSIPVGNTGGAFAIDNAGNITVANSAALNFETTPVFTLTVQVRDQGGTGIIDTATITVNLNDINDAPTATNLTTTSVYNEGDASVAISDIVVSDADTGETITATLTLADTSAGSLSANDGATYTSGTGVWTITDTVANVNLALANLVFTPTVNNDVDTTINVSIDDGDEDNSGPLTGTIILDVTPANDEQVLTVNTGATVLEGSSGNILTAGMLATTDADNTAGQLVYTLSGAPANGTLYLSGVALGVSDSFTQDDIDNDRVTYDHDGSETVGDGFAFSVDDGVGVTSSASFAITVTPVNDAPTISLINTTTTICRGRGYELGHQSGRYRDCRRCHGHQRACPSAAPMPRCSRSLAATRCI